MKRKRVLANKKSQAEKEGKSLHFINIKKFTLQEGKLLPKTIITMALIASNLNGQHENKMKKII
ncbi:hypothetical protein G7074_21820 [Pedobacter sp. HDW13]|uniref:hypothetical protein n=1 Tax=Pedobacter sp. HDW13 TaxID=2714940 RepID=UPI0014091A7D|nr:hypothetical protein [Pedobacter sp. HDW13]QIL41672.1 hypothetical protein G7074_21820 [Pedobacter sp. HDW13]